jgi:hypothetical protein
VKVEMATSHCSWYFDLIHATACVIEAIHFILGNITHVLSHCVSANNTQLLLGSICKKAFTSFCSVICVTTSITTCLVFPSSFLIIQLYNRLMDSSNVLSLVNTPLEVRRFHLSSNREKNNQILSSALYLL